MKARSCLAIVLAAGEGTRMRSARPKVMHALAGRSMLAHVLAAVGAAGTTATAVVVGPKQDEVAEEAKRALPGAEIFVQHARKGTAHAVLAGKAAIARKKPDDILIVFGDTPLIAPATLQRLRAPLVKGAAIAVLAFRPENPTGYGRVIVRDGAVVAIREEADANARERAVALCNGGIMAFDGKHALAILEKIGNANRKHEFYLTDAVAIARGMKLAAVAVEGEEDDVRGINTKAQLAEAESVTQQRLRKAALEAGVTLIAPETVYLSADTKFGKDVTVEPYVVFGEKVKVDDSAVIRSFSHLTGAHVGRGAIVGPFARLRPGAKLHEDVHIGNFVEVKEATVEAGAKANHLSYIGDATVGAGSNIGAGAYVGSGSVITANVPADALALGRSRQVVKEGWASRLRSLKNLRKKQAPTRK